MNIRKREFAEKYEGELIDLASHEGNIFADQEHLFSRGISVYKRVYWRLAQNAIKGPKKNKSEK